MTHLRTAFMLLLTMTFLTGFIYPLFITLISQLLMPYKAGGSLVISGEKIIGSTLIAQNFNRDVYFHPRPSAVDFDPMKPAGGSNLGPTSKSLKAIVEERTKQYPSPPPAELVYASGSGLDPHLSVAAIEFQMERVIKARAIANPQQLRALVASMTEGLTNQYVNVLLLNLALDKQFPLQQIKEEIKRVIN